MTLVPFGWGISLTSLHLYQCQLDQEHRYTKKVFYSNTGGYSFIVEIYVCPKNIKFFHHR